ncbi:MAG: hypothetical protein A2W30_09735 [Ignavibacteria bacterium RBG_16_36_9]|nr:MAG: hypothetical protein A2W30_09735 [Ignavibacteria bacterium RBG_16_36_9]
MNKIPINLLILAASSKKINILYILFLFFLIQAGYSQEKIILKNADKLQGETINGESVRKATGNVQFTQGNVDVYCNSATQYITSNRVELIGNVKIYQDTLSLFTNKAVYFGNERRAICEGVVTLKDPNATLRANGGYYLFNESKAVFSGDVIIINPEYRITSNYLTYLRNTEDSFAKGNVIVTTDSAIIKAENIDFYKRQGKTFAFEIVSIESDSSIITSDTLTNYSHEGKSIASGNVKINDLNNNATVYGNYLENYENTNYSFIEGNAKLIQIEKENDTLFLYSKKMEAFRNKPEYYVATDSVEVIRGEFLSKCGLAVYSTSLNKIDESINLSIEPIVWQENLQLTGDSIYAELYDRELRTIYVKKLSTLSNSKNSFLVIHNEDEYFNDRYDQTSGTDITMYFENENIKKVDVSQNSKSIYFLYEDKKANGLNIAEGENMFIYFDDEQKVSKIRIDEEPVGQYVPEIMINSVSLTLPGFHVRNDKPVRR